MSRRSILWALAGLVLSAAGCAQTPTGWRHFQGDLSGQGFLNVKSGYAVSPAWKSEPPALPAHRPWSAGTLWALKWFTPGPRMPGLRPWTPPAGKCAGGGTSWQAKALRSSIVGSPTVGDDGGVLVLTTTELAGGRLQSSLHKVDALGIRRWSFACLRLDMKDVPHENLLPPYLRKGTFSQELFGRFGRVDNNIQQRYQKARRRGSVLRYVGILEGRSARAGLKEIPPGHPFAGTKGSDNIIAITTHRYSRTPLMAGDDLMRTRIR